MALVLASMLVFFVSYIKIPKALKRIFPRQFLLLDTTISYHDIQSNARSLDVFSGLYNTAHKGFGDDKAVQLQHMFSMLHARNLTTERKYVHDRWSKKK